MPLFPAIDQQQMNRQMLAKNLRSSSATNDMLRPDNTKKGFGWLGPLTRPDGKVSTELSIGMDFGDGKETLLPLIVPTLSQQETQWLLNNDIEGKVNTVPRSIMDKAIQHAQQRMAAGLSPFADGGQ